MKLKIGDEVEFVDKTRPNQAAQRGKIVGLDANPPRKSKRKGMCYVINVDAETEWQVREEEEVTKWQS